MGFEPTTFGTTIRRSNQLNYTHHPTAQRYAFCQYLPNAPSSFDHATKKQRGVAVIVPYFLRMYIWMGTPCSGKEALS